MSRKEQVLIIKPFSSLVKTENYVFSDFECPYCNGRGGFADNTNANYFTDPDWKVCGLCDGAKRLIANVTVEWNPSKTDSSNMRERIMDFQQLK